MAATMVSTSAPGKLFLFGEYGVLAGGWSLVAGIERRVIAHRTSEPSSYEAVGADLEDPGALPRAVLAALGKEPTETSIDQLATDVRQFYTTLPEAPGRQKLGLGSSAASAAALTAACIAYDGFELDAQVRKRVFDRAFAAHRRLQDGRGSGADVAASTFGGLVGYRLSEPSAGFVRCEAPRLSEEPLRLRQAEMKLFAGTSLRIEPIWLGKPAVSTSFVSACREALDADPERVLPLLSRTSRLAYRAIEALLGDNPDALFERDLVTRADRTLEALGEAIGAPIVTEAHRQLRTLAKPHGLSVKPSGAGGGDFSLVFGPFDAPWSHFLDALPEDLHRIDLTFGAEGVRIEPT